MEFPSRTQGWVGLGAEFQMESGINLFLFLNNEALGKCGSPSEFPLLQPVLCDTQRQECSSSSSSSTGTDNDGASLLAEMPGTVWNTEMSKIKPCF